VRSLSSRQKANTAGFAEQAGGKEVIILELCGAMFKMPKDKDLFAFDCRFLLCR
jgi:hypothetical protein